MIEFNHFPQALALLIKGVNEGVGTAADAIAELAGEMAPTQSGFMASTIYVSAQDHDTYGQDVGEAPGDSYLLPEEDRDGGAIVGVAANYGAYVELGTRFMAPEPFLGPAAETFGAANFEEHFADLESFITGGLT
jgi:hypothetical protein